MIVIHCDGHLDKLVFELEEVFTGQRARCDRKEDV
jgi:hypothetical protein